MRIFVRVIILCFFGVLPMILLLACVNSTESKTTCNLDNYVIDTTDLFVKDSFNLDYTLPYFGTRLIIPLRKDLNIRTGYISYENHSKDAKFYEYNVNDYDIKLEVSLDFHSFQKRNKSNKISDIDAPVISWIPLNSTATINKKFFLDAKRNSNYQIFTTADSTIFFKNFYWMYKSSVNRARVSTIARKEGKIIKWGSSLYKEVMGCSDEYFLLNFSEERVDSTMLDSLLF